MEVVCNLPQKGCAALSRLEMKGIKKSFGGVHALKGVDLDLYDGEVLGLCGENGAGKSTLMKILSGAVTKDHGEILLDGKPIQISSPKTALAHGISVIYQELNMAPHLNVAENVFLGGYLKSTPITLDWGAMYKKSFELINSLGTQISPKRRVSTLSIAQQQLVEIARALKNQAKILVMDEPSAALGKKDSENLFDLIARLKETGVSIIYISHRLDEVLRITDRVMILRDGEHIVTKDSKELSMADLITYMTGKEHGSLWDESKRAAMDENAPIKLEVRNLNRGNVISDVSFKLRAGEVLGLAGLVGSGRSEIARAIFGIDRLDSGEIFIDGKRKTIKRPKQAMNAGIGFVMEDRKQMGLMLRMSIRHNTSITDLKPFLLAGIWINGKKECQGVAKLGQQLATRMSSIFAPVSSLSGGNQQKVVIAKWLHILPDILILDEPTRGVDVGAKSEIYQIIDLLKANGKAILLISSEFAEIIGLSDRIIAIRRGCVVGEFDRKEFVGNVEALEVITDDGVQ